jgi:DNA-binding CsgD family transcriptional regulator
MTVSDLAAIGLGDLLATLREGGIQRAETISSRGSAAVLQVETAAPLATDRLQALDPVSGWDEVGTSRPTHGYVVEVTEPAFPTCIADRADDIVGTPEARFGDQVLSVTLVGHQVAIGEVLERYDALGLTPALERLGRYEATERTLDRLTARQREVLRTAYRVGYFEVPREGSAADVAAELDIGQSTVVEHLRRAERNLLAGQLDGAEP